MISPNHTKQHTIDFRDKQVAIIGMGVTGRSCASFLLKQGAFISAFDRQSLDKDTQLEALSADKHASPQRFETHLLTNQSSLREFDHIVLSPGVDPRHPAVQSVIDSGKIISDLDIFAAFNTIPCIGVSGSNGKSTVVDMLYQTLNASGYKALLGGNFGTGALDLLGQEADFIVLELSSFQLDITQNLPLAVACILNITEDHIDRHGNFAAYSSAKQAIFKHAQRAIINRDDMTTFVPEWAQKNVQTSAIVSAMAPVDEAHTIQSVLDDIKPSAEYGQAQFSQDSSGIYLNGSKLIGADELTLALPHMMLNMQFVLAVHISLGLPLATALKTLKAYRGLAHRFEIVLEQDGLIFVNDSKATNPGACLAAISCAHQLGWHIILLAGGDAKGADLSSLSHAFNSHVSKAFVYGKHADELAKVFLSHHQSRCAKQIDLFSAVDAALAFAEQLHTQSVASVQSAPIAILLSPACASTDMFKNYVERGQQFTQYVREKAGEAA